MRNGTCTNNLTSGTMDPLITFLHPTDDVLSSYGMLLANEMGGGPGGSARSLILLVNYEGPGP